MAEVPMCCSSRSTKSSFFRRKDTSWETRCVSGAQPGLSCPAPWGCLYLVRLSVDEDAHNLAEEAGQQRVEAAATLQEAVQPVQERLICTQGIVDLGHVGGQDLTCHTGVPAGGRWGLQTQQGQWRREEAPGGKRASSPSTLRTHGGSYTTPGSTGLLGWIGPAPLLLDHPTALPSPGQVSWSQVDLGQGA